MDITRARSIIASYTNSEQWASVPAPLTAFVGEQRVDFDDFLESLLTLAHLFGGAAREDVESLVEWAPDAPAGTWLPEASDALAAVLSLITDWEQGRMLPEGHDEATAKAFAAKLSSVVEASGSLG